MHKNHTCIHKVFEQQVLKKPDNIAIKFQKQDITYEQLNERANFLAHNLQSKGVRDGTIVAVAISHSAELVIAMLAVLKCGAAYLPIDDSNPITRNQHCINETEAEILIIADDTPRAYSKDLKVISVNENSLSNTSFLENFNSHFSKPDDKAYVMFTSGSTGSPKGVVIPHQAVIRLVKNTNYIDIKTSDRILQFAPPSFDASTFEFWGALLNGAGLVPYSGQGLDPNILKRDIEENDVSILWLTAALFHLVADKFIEALFPLRVLLAGGDVLNPKYINKVLDAIPDITIINGYGPTENTTFTCCHVMTKLNRPLQNVLIGKSITGTQVHILDDDFAPVEKGNIGELFASGLGVALGYLNDANQKGAFFYDENIASGLIYRTGDLVRENNNSEFEFIGRKDNQVKIRGYRVSLEEIKTSIVEVDEISDALVITKKFDSGDQLLIAYVQVKEGIELEPKKLKIQLAAVLPGYMIPDQIILSSKLPINENGKINTQEILKQQMKK